MLPIWGAISYRTGLSPSSTSFLAASVPIIGIGAGPHVDGQVLVTHDLIGLFDKFIPKFVKQYTQIRPIILEALQRYKTDVQEETFPGPEHSFNMPKKALTQLRKMVHDS